MPTLHLFADESGDFTFAPQGTQYYVFAVVWTYEPRELAQSITDLRIGLLKEGHDVTCFSAAEDRENHRQRFITTVLRDDQWRFAAVVVEKRKVQPYLQDRLHFYPSFMRMAFRFVLRGRIRSDTTQVLAFTETLPMQKHRDAVEKSFKLEFAQELPDDLPFSIYHHPAATNPWLQVVDYCSWSVFRKWERAKLGHYDRLKSHLAAEELDVLKGGATHYY